MQAGQTVAEIEAPEMEEQVRQSKANLQHAQAAVDQALANYEQGKSDTELARVTAERWARLAAKGVVSRQENDQYQAQYHSRNSGAGIARKGGGECSGAMWLPPKRAWRGSKECRATWW